ncbi:hypothetical protein VI817_006662 [Penicillium citrinum]|nr:hypothetical protein VI817_006662 [Penicillium citrinum]
MICGEKRPCENCTQAHTECISSEPIDRRYRFSADYTRSLQERVAELEAQSLGPSQGISHGSQNTPAGDPWSGDEGPRLQHMSTAINHTPGTHTPSHHLPSALSGSGTEPTHNYIVPACPTSNFPFLSPTQAGPLNQGVDVADRCGHSSLLISILAALSSGNPCGIQNTTNINDIRDVRVPPIRVADLITPENSIYLPDAVSDALIEIYLQRVNPRYPFLHVDTFLDWYRSWKSRRQTEPTAGQKDRWKDFFVVMVQAVSILLTPQVSQNDISTSQSLYNAAMKFLPLVFTHPSPVLHVQAYLVLTLHALHSPSSQMIVSMVSSTMRHCAVNQLHLADTEPKDSFPAFSLEVQIRRRVFWSAYALDRLISWIYHIPNNLIDEHITVEMFSNVEDTHLYKNTAAINQIQASDLSQRTRISPTLHLIRCRCIQSRIISTMMRSDFHKIDASSTWRQHMLEELESWKTHIERLSHRSSRGYLSDRWVGMAYNYTILLLHQPTKETASGIFGDRSVKASIKIMLTFREFQKDRQTAQLWPGLLSQFNVGVTFLYCFWATPIPCRSSAYKSPEVLEALRACSTSLAILSERWAQAEPLRDIFDILAKEIPVYEVNPSPKHISVDAASYIKSQMDWLRVVVKNRVVLRMLEEIITDDFLSTPMEHPQKVSQQEPMEHETGEHICSEHCSLFPGTVFHNPMASMGVEELEEEYETFEDSLIFPSLFGSAEF